MNLNASIIDQRLAGVQAEIATRAADELNLHDPGRLKSLAFVYLCVQTLLDLDMEQAFDCLTEGGGDFGVDALHMSEEVDDEFVVTLFQSKYRHKLDATGHFEEKGIEALIKAIRHIFNPAAELGQINERLRIKVEAVRSMIRDGWIPRVRAVACSNGQRWNASAQQAIEREGFGEQVSWEHLNHDGLLALWQRLKPVNETLRLVGKAVVEDMNFSRVCLGRLPVTEVAALMRIHGERLLERNIRRYLGLHGNRVNEGIQATLRSHSPADFYFFNNGLTVVCDDFAYNALQGSDYQIKVDNLQIVNGGQTCMTILKTEQELNKLGQHLPADASVLVRIYKLPKDNEDLVLQITHATNSQNPVDLKDLRANDARQQQLEHSLRDLGFTYRRKRMEGASKAGDISSGQAAEAILAVWRHAPHQARFLTRAHFGKLYETIFTEQLNGAQTIIAVLLHRLADQRRRRPAEDDPLCVRYAACFIAMQMGRRLLAELGISLAALDHRHFAQAKTLLESKAQIYFDASVADVERALAQLYGGQPVSLQQLAATFRRGDVIDTLLGMPV